MIFSLDDDDFQFLGVKIVQLYTLLLQSHHLLYTYFNRKSRLHVNSQDLKILKLIKEKKIKCPSMSLKKLNQNTL
jgi:hypothetical protein